MRLYFLRHGEAEDEAPSGRDYDRELTPAGIAQLQRVAAGLAKFLPEVNAILTSPLPRARETAEIAAKAINHPGDVTVDDLLASGRFGMRSLQKLTEAFPNGHKIVLVGHEPDFSETIRSLTGGVVEMRKAGIAFVETNRVEAGAGYLRWLLPPKLIERLGGAAD